MGDRLVRRWNDFWFPEQSALNLSLCRIILCAGQLFVFVPFMSTSLEEQVSIVENSGGEFDHPQVLISAICAIVPQERFQTAATIKAIYWVTYAAGLLTLVGLMTRASALLFAMGNWIQVAHIYSYGEKHHPEALVCIFFLLLALSPSGRCLSVDAWWRGRAPQRPDAASWGVSAMLTTSVWALKVTQVLISLAYLCAGLCKLHMSGLSWMNGYTLQQHIMTDSVRWGRPLGYWVAQHHDLCVVLSVGAIVIELVFFVAVVVPRAVPFVLVSGVMMHVGIDLMQAAQFYPLVLLYVVFIDFEGLRRRWVSRGHRQCSEDA